MVEFNMFYLVFTGACTGAGSAIGTFFSNKLLIKHLEKIEERLKQK